MREGLISDEESVELWGEEKDRRSGWFEVGVVNECFGGCWGREVRWFRVLIIPR